MSKLLEMIKNPGMQIGLLVGFLVIVSAGIWGLYTTQVPPAQPILFPHKTHVNLQSRIVAMSFCEPRSW